MRLAFCAAVFIKCQIEKIYFFAHQLISQNLKAAHPEVVIRGIILLLFKYIQNASISQS